MARNLLKYAGCALIALAGLGRLNGLESMVDARVQEETQLKKETETSLEEKKKELQKMLGDNYLRFDEKKYEEALILPGALEFFRAIDSDFLSFCIPNYVQLLKTGKALEIINTPGSNFKSCFAKSYCKLLEKGINPKAIAKMPVYSIDTVLKEITDKEIPPEVLPFFTHSAQDYSILAAGSNPVFGTDFEKIKTYIKRELEKVEHSNRENTDYDENAAEIDSVGNINMLYLVKGYVDFFKSPENRQKVRGLLKKDSEDPFSEHGGLVICDNGKYTFVPVSPVKKQVPNLEDNFSYCPRDWINYVGCVGKYHFHATTKENKKYSGPSGASRLTDQILRQINGDLGKLRLENETNLYQMNCVVTLMGDKFNADIYFRDVEMGLLEKKSNSDKITVIDIGVF
jgi:hypothetical protein